MRNPTTITRNKIVLQKMNEFDFANAEKLKDLEVNSDDLTASELERKRFLEKYTEEIKQELVKRCQDRGSKKFQMSKRSQAIMKAIAKADQHYFKKMYRNKLKAEIEHEEPSSLKGIAQHAQTNHRPSSIKAGTGVQNSPN